MPELPTAVCCWLSCQAAWCADATRLCLFASIKEDLCLWCPKTVLEPNINITSTRFPRRFTQLGMPDPRWSWVLSVYSVAHFLWKEHHDDTTMPNLIWQRKPFTVLTLPANVPAVALIKVILFYSILRLGFHLSLSSYCDTVRAYVRWSALSPGNHVGPRRWKSSGALAHTCAWPFPAPVLLNIKHHTPCLFFFKAHAFIYQYTVLTLWGEQIYNWLWLRVASRGGERIRFTPVSTKSIFWNSADKKMKKKCHHTNVLIVCACSLCPFVGVVLTSTEGGCLCCMTKTPVSACRVWAHDDKVAVNISTAANEPNINIWGKWSHCLGLTSATFYSGFVTRNKLTCWKKC